MSGRLRSHGARRSTMARGTNATAKRPPKSNCRRRPSQKPMSLASNAMVSSSRVDIVCPLSCSMIE
jgi:hypothetical protein